MDGSGPVGVGAVRHRVHGDVRRRWRCCQAGRALRETREFLPPRPLRSRAGAAAAFAAGIHTNG